MTMASRWPRGPSGSKCWAPEGWSSGGRSCPQEDLLVEASKLAREGRFDYLLVESTGISEPRAVAEPRLGRRTVLTFPLLPPPQKN